MVLSPKAVGEHFAEVMRNAVANRRADAIASHIVNMLRIRWNVPSVSSEDVELVANEVKRMADEPVRTPVDVSASS
jgi:hypothetical protein